MGGNALNIQTKRLKRDDYLALWDRIRKRLDDAGVRYHLVRSYRAKEDFGDLDVLIHGAKDQRMVQSLFHPTEMLVNGNCISFDVDNFQVDFIFFAGSSTWEFAQDFFAYSVLGELIGKIARFMRYKFGPDGLFYVVYNDMFARSRLLGEVCLTEDPRSAFAFLGFDYDRFQEGFDTLEDVFQYVIQSTYFSHSAFDPSILNAARRYRDRHRGTIKAFLEYIEKIPRIERPRPTFEEAVEKADRYFPSRKVALKVVQLMYHDQMNQEISRRFNGQHVIEHFGLQGRELATALAKFRQTIESEFVSQGGYKGYVMQACLEKILQDFERVTGYPRKIAR